MAIIWDEPKRQRTLKERGLDFADAEIVFGGEHFNGPDSRRDYVEERFITAGWLRGRFVILVWTPRAGDRRIISMRYGHADEEKYYKEAIS
jgi:uncharacterized protein